MHDWPQERAMGMNLSEEEFLGRFREDEVPDGWYGGFEYDWWAALCVER